MKPYATVKQSEWDKLSPEGKRGLEELAKAVVKAFGTPRPSTTKLCRRVGRRKATMNTETQRPTLLAAATGPAATCQWEEASPPSICGKPAEYEDASGKKLCKRHGEYIKNRWPESVTKLMPPNGPDQGRRASDSKIL